VKKLLPLAAVLAVLAACNGNNTTTSTPTPAPPYAPTATPNASLGGGN
jgi:uncharacterized lipoprotein YajG